MNIKTLKDTQNKINVAIQESINDYKFNGVTLDETNRIQKELHYAYDSIQAVINTINDKSRQ